MRLIIDWKNLSSKCLLTRTFAFLSFSTLAFIKTGFHGLCFPLVKTGLYDWLWMKIILPLSLKTILITDLRIETRPKSIQITRSLCIYSWNCSWPQFSMFLDNLLWLFKIAIIKPKKLWMVNYREILDDDSNTY